ncbi:MAG: GGDEF domain-containing protein [Pseudomonadota bacterium]|nr:GGDEF domain-containing protein [Pseudomonadota bacterium]
MADRFNDLLLRRFDNILDWTPVQKSVLLMSVLAFIFAQYLLLHWYYLAFPSDYVDVSVATRMTKWHVLLLVSSVAFIVVARRYKKVPRAQVIIPYLCTFYYSITLVGLGYLIGLLTAASGMVMIGAPLLGMVLLGQRVVYVSMAFALVLIFILSLLTALNYIPYAPLFVPEFWIAPEARLSLFSSVLFFSAPHFVFIVAFADLILRQRRQRDEMIRQLSLTDSLTGIDNRRAVCAFLHDQLTLAKRKQRPIAVVIADLDRFKSINDRFGHLIGDQALKLSAACFEATIRESDRLGRYGGEEFLIVFPETSIEEAAEIAERCRQRLTEVKLYAENGQRVALSASFGVYGVPDGQTDMDALVRYADQNMYAAKQAGRNRVCADMPELEQDQTDTPPAV